MKNKHIENALIFGIVVLFIFSAVSPLVIGYHVDIKEPVSDKATNDEIDFLNRYNKYNVSELLPEEYYPEGLPDTDEIGPSFVEPKLGRSTVGVSNGPMDSPWPMYCHDTRHTGQSPYSTVDIWDEIWRFKQHKNDYVRSSPVVGDDGTIYFGGLCDFYALYPNGTMKWKYDGLDFYVWSAPAIDENGTIYVGDRHGYFYAINPNGILKWKFKQTYDILSSPAIGEDGTIYFGDADKYINALWPNGTVRWRYKTGHVVYSSPAIGDDGTIYCGSHDTYLYALYPNNGTLKWKYKTGHWVRVSPCIADDGTIYVVSLDNHLHALYHNGTLKWKTNMGHAGTSPTIGQEGTIYCGYTKLYAINPKNGSVKWTFDVSGAIKGSTPCHSLDDIIYFGSGCWLYAVYSDGTLKWREKIANEFVDSAPAIGEDGTVYIGSAWEISGYSRGYLHAFGIGELEADANGPYYGLINQPVQFKGSARGGYSPYVSWHWTFGDGGTSDEQNPTHTYTEAGNYSVTLTVTDNTSNTSSDTTWAWIQVTNTPPNKPTIDGPTSGVPWTSYPYTFSAIDPDGTPIWYYIDWDDGEIEEWIGPYSSGEEVIRSHTWTDTGTYTIKAKAKDPYEDEGPWGELEVIMPRNRATYNSLFLRFFEQFPLVKRLLSLTKLIK